MLSLGLRILHGIRGNRRCAERADLYRAPVRLDGHRACEINQAPNLSCPSDDAFCVGQALTRN